MSVVLGMKKEPSNFCLLAHTSLESMNLKLILVVHGNHYRIRREKEFKALKIVPGV